MLGHKANAELLVGLRHLFCLSEIKCWTFLCREEGRRCLRLDAPYVSVRILSIEVKVEEDDVAVGQCVSVRTSTKKVRAEGCVLASFDRLPDLLSVSRCEKCHFFVHYST